MKIPFIVITLDRPYECRFSYKASMRYQQLTGHKLTELAQVDLDNMPGLLQAMLQEYIPTLTTEQVVEMIDQYADSMIAIQHLVAACVDAAYNVDAENPNVKALAAIGKIPNI